MKENPYVRNKTIRKAFELLNEWEYENLNLDSIEDVQCSAEYTKRMEKLIRAQKRPFWKYTNTVGKRVAVFALVILLLFGASMSVSAVRKPVVEFIVNAYEKFVEIFFGEENVAEAPGNIDTIYTLGKVPEGYELVEYRDIDTSVKIAWKNREENMIRFSQQIFDVKTTYDFDFSNYTIMYVSDVKVAYIEKLERKMLYWNCEDYAFSLRVPSEFSLEECALLIESLELIDKND